MIFSAIAATSIQTFHLIGGLKFRHDKYRKGSVKYNRAIVTCPFHNKCIRHRNASARNCRLFGEWEPIGFLCAWARLGGSCNAGKHVKEVQPTRAQILEFLQSVNLAPPA